MDKSMIPCKECLVIPICRHKLYGILMQDCDKLRDFIYRGVTNHPRINRPMLLMRKRRDKTDQALIDLEKVLKPSDWSLLWDQGKDRYTIESLTRKPKKMML